jgi:SSS family solute:Na+ symporter
MNYLDWFIVFLTVVLTVISAIITKSCTRSVADFLAANRCAGRYVLGISDGMANLGAISVIAMFEMYYQSGFSGYWWSIIWIPISMFIAMSGWVVYRFRQTQALTVAQFFEMRYSKNFRIFAGIIAFVSGIINFGIFPAVGTRFFMYYCHLPSYFNFFNLEISVYPILMGILLSLSLLFVYLGGQIAVMVTDFIQSIFCMFVGIAIMLYFVSKFDWNTVTATMSALPAGKSLLNPFDSNNVEGFNLSYFLIISFGMFYGTMAWQGSQGYFAAAKNPHESKMGRVVGEWRRSLTNIPILILPIIAFVVMHNPEFKASSDLAGNLLNSIDNNALRQQQTVAVALSYCLPHGMLGAFCAFMVCAFLGNHNSYMHSWGSILVQDVILPLRKGSPLNNQQHLRLLRIAICFVAIFIYCFSLLFTLKDFILMFFNITGAIFTGGAGSAIIGGLYWKRGTTLGAWAAMITSIVGSVTGIAIQQLYNDFPLNGTQMFFGVMLLSMAVYIGAAFIGDKRTYDLNKLLHRTEGSSSGSRVSVISVIKRYFNSVVCFGPEFSKSDKWICAGTILWTLSLVATFIIINVVGLIWVLGDDDWMNIWKIWIYVFLVMSLFVTIWLTWGGLRDMIDLFRTLKLKKRDFSDDGTVSLPEIKKTIPPVLLGIEDNN